MKLFALIAFLIASSVFGLQVTRATYDPETDHLEVLVQYSGGCLEHQFELRLTNCAFLQTKNISALHVCDGEIVDITNKEDRCKALIKRQLHISLGTLSNDKRPALIGFESDLVFVANKGRNS